VFRLLWRRYPVLVLCVVAGLLASLVILRQRVAVERAYHTVEITIDGDDWATLARRNGMDREDLYADLYRQGARSVTLYAVSLRRLADAGQVAFLTGADALNAARTGTLGGPLADLVRSGRVHRNDTYVLGALPALRVVQAGFAIQIGASHAVLLQGSGPVLEIGGRGRDVEDASLGVLPEEATAARSQHLAAEVRVRNFREVAPGGLEAFFENLRQTRQALTLIFDRDQVLGYDRLIPDVAEQMKQNGFAFGLIESFSAKRRQKGEETLARLVEPAVIRVFSLTPEELQGLSPNQARDKFVLAARERNVRILYVRPFLITPAGVDEIGANLDYVGSIAGDLTRAGYKIGKAAPLPSGGKRTLWVAFAALGALAAGAIAVGEVGQALSAALPSRWLVGGVGIGLALTGAALAAHHDTLWRQILALLAALAFPTLSMMYLVPGARRREGPDPESGTGHAGSGLAVVARSIAGLWTVSAVTALGGLLVAALLTEWLFMMEIREFLGVKLAHVLPVVLIGLLVAAATAPRGALWPRLRAWLRQPLLLEYGIAIIVIGVLVVFALGRSGNIGLPLLGTLESKSRILLQHLFVARPRTKEFLVGHPAMVLTFALAALGAWRWVLPAAMIAAVGQVGLVNSFSHIHTPLVYVLFRTIYALVLGSMIGAVLVGLLWWSRRWWATGNQVPGPLRPRAGMPPMA
jgi:Family of unknown function (DUF5693)